MAIANISCTKIVDDEDEEDEAPFVASKASIGGGVVVTHCSEECWGYCWK